MLITGKQPTDELQTVSRNISILKQKMDSATAKRRRYTSSNSCGSTTTQMTNVSDDSTQPTSPTESIGSQFRPVFRLGSQDDGQPSRGSSNVGPSGARTTWAPSCDKGFEARRAQIKAKRALANRRQSESIIENYRTHEAVPHRCHTTMCMEHGSMQEEMCDETVQKQLYSSQCSVGSRGSTGEANGRCNSRVNLQQRFDSMLGHTPHLRAKSVDGLESLRISGQHLYDLPTGPSVLKKDTEIVMGNGEAGVRISRKRLHSSTSETPPDYIYNDTTHISDVESGYVRAADNNDGGFCVTLSACIKRHAITILVLINLVFFIVFFGGFTYLILKLQQAPDFPIVPEKSSLECFSCWDMSYDTKKDFMLKGQIEEHGKDRCCFKSSDVMNSWIIQHITSEDSRGMFIYLTGSVIIDYENNHRIQWKDDKIGPMKVGERRTAITVEEKGFYFIFSMVQFHGSEACSEHTQALSHTINKATVADSTGYSLVEYVSKKCTQTDDVTMVVHMSSLQTIAHLKEGDRIFVGVKNTEMVHQGKDHTIGIFKIK